MSIPVCFHCKEAFIRDVSGKRYNRFSLVVKVHPGAIPLGQAMSELLQTDIPSSPTDFVCDKCFSTAKSAYSTKKAADLKVREFKLNLHQFTKRQNLGEGQGDFIIEESYDEFMKVHIESINEDQTVTSDDIHIHVPSSTEPSMPGQISPSKSLSRSEFIKNKTEVNMIKVTQKNRDL